MQFNIRDTAAGRACRSHTAITTLILSRDTANFFREGNLDWQVVLRILMVTFTAAGFPAGYEISHFL
ncbi:hypothetical protein SEF58_09015 [Neomoorella humiferrea]